MGSGVFAEAAGNMSNLIAISYMQMGSGIPLSP
jgi:hypothetical protein